MAERWSASPSWPSILPPTASYAESGPHLTRVNVMVHGLALAATPLAFLELFGLWRRLASSDVATAWQPVAHLQPNPTSIKSPDARGEGTDRER